PAAAEILPVGEEVPLAAGTVRSRLVSPAVAYSAAGEIVVAWEGFRQGLDGRRLDARGRPAGPEISLATNELPPRVPYRGPMTLQREPTVVGLRGGALLAVWVEELHDVSVDVFYQRSELLRCTVVAQRLSPRGRQVGPQIVLSDDDLGLAGSPRVARLSDDRVLVVGHSAAEGAGEPGVYGRLLNHRGGPGEPAFRVDSPAGPPGSRPVVAAAEDGGFLVAWHGCCDSEGPGVFGRRYGASAEPAGEPFLVNATEAGWQLRPELARGSAGEFLVAWLGPGDTESSLTYRVYGQVLAGDGTPLGPELALSDGGGRLHGAPALVAAGDGYLAAWVVWKDDFPVAIVAAELDRNGAPIGDLLRVSSRPLGLQWRISLAGDGEGGYFAAWEGFDDQGSPSINTRRLTGTVRPSRSVELGAAGD
ncbi:MAG TPA: hypothetical protein VLF66_14110, partial [Thermoanaerobaculia bacterium]|nr:hypothetical protein [Thermoanaerobaculia bacterium]